MCPTCNGPMVPCRRFDTRTVYVVQDGNSHLRSPVEHRLKTYRDGQACIPCDVFVADGEARDA